MAKDPANTMKKNPFLWGTRTIACVLCLSLMLSLAACGLISPSGTTAGQKDPADTKGTTITVTTTAKDPVVDSTGETTGADPVVPPTSTGSDEVTMPTVPTDTKPTEPTPTETKPTEPKPTESKPTEPKPTESKPTEPKPTESKPTEPKPTESKPTEPKPTETKPTEPKPTETKPTEPAPTNPTGNGNGDNSNQKHTALDYTKRYMYSMLSDDLKLVYRKIDEAVRNFEMSVYFDVDITYDNRYEVYYMYMNDHPELFYLGNSVAILQRGNEYGFSFYYSDGVVTCGYDQAVTEMTPELRASIQNKQAKFNAEVEKIISTIPTNLPDVEKERLIYDYILKESKYNTEAVWNSAAPNDWTAYGVIVNKRGVCEAYSEAFQTLCYAVGINCTGIVGTANGDHKWNAVELDGAWYMCDITYDDPVGAPEGAVYHKYFNLTRTEIEKLDHVIDESKWPAPVCTATKYSYANYFGEE